jgi:ketosteroid isomerase-like protein
MHSSIMKLVTPFFLILTTCAAGISLQHPSSLNQDLHIHDVILSHRLSAQKSTSKAFIDAYNAWDLEGIMGYRGPDCLQQIYPSSMGKSPKNNAEYRKYFENIMPIFSNFTITIHKEFHDAEARTCVIHASSKANTRAGIYSNEYALFLWFTKDGSKITRIDEFVDSAYSAQFFAKLGMST